MQRVGFIIAFLAATAAIAAPPASAKWGIELGSTPTTLEPGDPWDVQVRVIGDHRPAPPAAPVVRIRSPETGFSQAYRSQPVPGTRRLFEATVVFPEGGLWRYDVRYAGARFTFEPVRIQPGSQSSARSSNEQPTPPASHSERDFPVWQLLGGLAIAALVAGTGAACVRRRRLLPWPAAPSSARTASRGR